MEIKKIDEQYKKQANERKIAIKQEPNKCKRFWKWVWYLISYPFVWSWYNFRDWRTFIIFIIVMLVIGCEVWVPLLLGLIFNNAWLLGIAGVCEMFWLMPATPFLPLCIVVTIAVKSIINKNLFKNKK